MWLKMSEVAKELGVSKDVVKYHRRSISDDLIEKKTVKFTFLLKAWNG